MVKLIELNNMKDAVRLNELASEQDFNLFVSCGSQMIDAKSFLALIALIGKSNIKLVAPDHLNVSKFMKIIEQL